MKNLLIDLITAKGSISISEFINESLFNPKKGYYNQKNPFGKEGDFITAPEISQVFGELIGAYLVNLWRSNYDGREVNLVEMGAGKGTLMKDLLKSTAKNPEFLKKTAINIVEISPRLQKIQQEALKDYKINWSDSFSKISHQKPIFFIANELFDCFAIDQFIKTKQGWLEKKVFCDKNNDLEFGLAPHNKIIDELIEKLAGKSVKEGCVFEYSSAAINFMKELSESIKNNGGIGIIIDYGYIKNEFKNTLQAVKNHQFCEVLKEAGSSDLTSLVNFDLLKNIAISSGLQTSLVNQKEFLESLGIEIRRKQLLKEKSVSQQQEINSSIDRLVDLKQMGDLFKCLIIWQ